MSIRKSIDSFIRQFEQDFIPQNQIEVSQSAIRHNLSLFSSLTDKQIIPVLKGNAYGHGLALVTQSLKDVNIPYIAVDGYFEALRIREVSKQPVLVMGAISPINFGRMKYDDFTFVVQDVTTVDALGATGKSIKVHLECNTGMNRYGVRRTEINALVRLILSYPNLHLEGVMSHLADSDGEDSMTVDAAVTLFDECVETVLDAGGKPTLFHVAQTAGSLKVHSKYANAMRLGIGLYGINPFSATSPFYKNLHDLKPVLCFTSTVTKVILLEKGDGVSYNYTYKAPKKMKLGIIPAGYYEGVPRALSNVGLIKIGHRYAPIVGRVCMNHTMINLDGIPAKVGDVVEIFSNTTGDRTTVDFIAHDHALFNYSLLTALSGDVRRVLIP
ncbi:MAG TPA: alanine racemase [Candidatus Chromulinivoraceae bacterium]|nr:alanine racemase [Candidatus Chromulinivoraceae bacterium]